MKDNTVNINSDNGDTVEVYTDHIYELVDQYIDDLNNPDDIYNKQSFAGLIKYISKNIDKPDITNMVLLNNLWDIYTSICYKYKAVVSIERYCILVNISRETFYSWYKRETRDEYCEELGCSRSDMIKKWDKESESSWQDEASTGNPGPMFVLKARRGWSEQAPAVGLAEERMLHRTPEQIAADYPVQIEQKTDVTPDF